MLTNESQIRALIRLLGDEDDRIVRTISGRLIDYGDSAVPLLQEAEIEQPDMANRIATILEEIRGSRLEDELRDLVTRPDEGHRPRKRRLSVWHDMPILRWMRDQYSQQLDEMGRGLRGQIGSRVSGEETVKALNRYLFTEQGFKGNTKNYYELENSYLNRVIDRRTGIPISLSVVYLLIGKRLGTARARNRHAGPFFGQIRGRESTKSSSIVSMAAPC